MTRTDPLTPEQLEPVACALAPYIDGRCSECAGSGEARASQMPCRFCGGTGMTGEREQEADEAARIAVTAAIDAGLVVRVEPAPGSFIGGAAYLPSPADSTTEERLREMYELVNRDTRFFRHQARDVLQAAGVPELLEAQARAERAEGEAQRYRGALLYLHGHLLPPGQMNNTQRQRALDEVKAALLPQPEREDPDEVPSLEVPTEIRRRGKVVWDPPSEDEPDEREEGEGT